MSGIAVECELDERGEGVPRRFGTGCERHEIVEILDRWPGRGHAYFRVRTGDGARFILRHDESAGTWRLWSFDDR